VHGVAIRDGVLYLTGFDEQLHALTRQSGDWLGPSTALGTPAKALVASAQIAGQPTAGALVACTNGEVQLVPRGSSGHGRRVLDRRGFGRARVDSRDGMFAVADDDGTLSLGDGAVFKDTDKLRGAVIAELDPETPGFELACAGYSGNVTVLTRQGSTWVPQVVHREPDRIHHLTRADLDGDGIDELVAASYSGNLLVIRRR